MAALPVLKASRQAPPDNSRKLIADSTDDEEEGAKQSKCLFVHMIIHGLMYSLS